MCTRNGQVTRKVGIYGMPIQCLGSQGVRYAPGHLITSPKAGIAGMGANLLEAVLA